MLQRPQTETIPALVAGNIAQIYARAGESVTTGQLFAVVYNPTLEYSAAGSHADYLSASANVDLARVQERNSKVGYQGQVETNKSNLDEAQRIYEADADSTKTKRFRVSSSIRTGRNSIKPRLRTTRRSSN